MGDRHLIVLDTHAWLWWVSEPTLLGRAAARRIDSARTVGIAAISCLEVATAAARGRISLDRDPLEWIEQALGLPRVELLPLTPRVAVKATRLGSSFPGDPADRLIVATAMLESADLISKDKRIHGYPAVNTVW